MCVGLYVERFVVCNTSALITDIIYLAAETANSVETVASICLCVMNIGESNAKVLEGPIHFGPSLQIIGVRTPEPP
jgi:hypothetical protein